MKTSVLLVSFIGSFGQVFGQQWPLKLEFGASTISKSSYTYFTEKITPGISGSMGIGYEYVLSEFQSLEIDLAFSFLSCSHQLTSLGSDPQNPYSTGITTTRRDFYFGYLTLPLYYKMHFGKLCLGTGIRPGFMLIRQNSFNQTGELLGEPYEINTPFTKFDMKPFDIGVVATIQYMISRKFSVMINAYSSIVKTEHQSSGFRFYNYQIGLGASYVIFGK